MSELLKPGERKTADPGYFRIGVVTLSIPPEEIVTNKIVNNEELMPLRSRFAMYHKTGHARWDVSVSWKALADFGTLGSDSDFKAPQWGEFAKVQQILAQFIASPFVEVENAHLRQLIVEQDPEYVAGDRMAFAMRQLRVDTIADIVDGLQITLTMSLFNYRPYSVDFSYQGERENDKVSAQASKAFEAYIAEWINRNIVQPKILATYPALQSWPQQQPGRTVFHWRWYDSIPKQGVPAPPTASQQQPAVRAATGPTKNIPAGGATKHAEACPEPTRSIIIRAAQQAGVDPNLALAVAQCESSFQHRLPSGALNTSPTGALGLFQVLRSNAQGADLGDEQTNANVGCRLLRTLLTYYNNDVTLALLGYGPGSAYVQYFSKQGYAGQALVDAIVSYKGPRWRKGSGLTGAYIDLTQFRNWIRNIGTIYSELSGKDPTPVASNQTQAPQSTPQAVWRTPDTVKTPPVKLQGEQVTSLAQQGWIVDHETDLSTLVYTPFSLELESLDYSEEDSPSRLYTTQISIVFQNNLAALPLEAYQYPTYQHIGASATSIAISLLSNGDMGLEEQEPQHPGLAVLTGMTSTLEQQFQRLKTQWRAVSSVHRMQAVVIENAVLNMLGIYAVIPQAVNTTTLPNSPNLVQASFVCSQYENVFEQVSPFMVKGVGAYEDIWLKQIFSNGDQFKQVVAANKDIMQPLTDVVEKKIDKRDWGPLLEFLLSNPNATTIPSNFNWEPEKQKQLSDLALNTLNGMNSRLGERVAKESSLSFTAVVALAQAVMHGTPAVMSSPYGLSIVQQSGSAEAKHNVLPLIEDYRARLDAAAKNGRDPVEEMYKQYIGWKIHNDKGIAGALGQAETSEWFRDEFKNAVNAQGPGADNLDHMCYRDMGLSVSSSGPADYFVDYSDVNKRAMFNGCGYAADQAMAVYQRFNSKEDATGVTVTSSEKAWDGSDKNAHDQISSLLRTAVAPGLSMARAYPTFKLFLIEDDNLHTFYMFDDFYSYASVLNMEIIRFQDKPDAAVIQISNLANLLHHKLYDTSVEGRFEYQNSFDMSTPTSSLGAVASDSGMDTSSIVNVSNARYKTQRANGNVNDLHPGFDDSGRRVPLHYFALQAGSKVQVRMGFSNNPDELEPVFSGIVTQLDEGPVLTIQAQGFAVELGDFDADTTKSGTRGGWLFTNGGGESVSIMKQMLSAQRSKHFGHWQVNSPAEPCLRGYGYDKMTHSVAEFFGAKRLSTLLLTSYDRSEENLLVEHSFTPDGDWAQHYSNFGFQTESLSPLENPQYTIPKDSMLSPWQVMQDIKRRYPEFILAVKQYGFPFACEATLVYAAPNSFYVSRLPLADEAEIGKIDKSDVGFFRIWWAANKDVVRKRFNDVTRVHTNLLLRLFIPSDHGWMAEIENAGDNMAEVFRQKVVQGMEWCQYAEGGYNLLTPGNQIDFSLVGLAYNSKMFAHNLRLELGRLLLQSQQQVQMLKNPTRGVKATDRFRPVRKWVLITSECIVKNSIVLNSDFFNTVKVQGESFSANAGIEALGNSRRILDCEKAIIAPKDNMPTKQMRNRYAQSFLRDEVGKMYRGELVLTGMPEIEPYDVLLLNDRSTGMMGPVEVESVNHVFDQESGFITIVKPRAFMALNEAMTAGLLDGCYKFMKSLLVGNESGDYSFAASETVHMAESVGRHSIPAVGAAGAAYGTYAVSKGVVDGMFARVVASQVAKQAAKSAAATLVRSAATGAAEAGAEMAVSFGLASWTAPILIGTGIVAAGAVCILASKQQKLNPLLLMPLTRFGHPWVAGIDGWRLYDLSSYFEQEWKVYETYAIEPYLQLVRDSFGLTQYPETIPVPWIDRFVGSIGKN